MAAFMKECWVGIWKTSREQKQKTHTHTHHIFEDYNLCIKVQTAGLV
jgi:hypothetical protein